MKSKFQYGLTSAVTSLSATAATKARTLQFSLIATALLALGAMAPPAYADAGRGEIRQDRRELRADYRELAEDRADYQRARARGDVFGMIRERMEIRQDKREIRRDQAELRHDLRDRRQDAWGHQSRDGRNQHAGYWNQGQRSHWGEQRQDNRMAFRQDRPEHAQAAQAHRANWQAPGRQQASPAGVQQNTGRHLGWQQGRGNPRGG